MSDEQHLELGFRLGSAPADSASLIFKNVLGNIPSGVMSLDTDGVVTSFNAAASKIIGLASEAVVGRTWAEIFSEMEGADDFADVIFDAIYDTSVGHQRVVQATFLGRVRSLSVATSYLKEERNGEAVRIGVVVVFSDISEIRELREKELRLARELQAKHAELRDAYVSLEERNRELSTTSRRRTALRWGASVVLLVLILGVGLYMWDFGPETAGTAAGSGAADAPQGAFTTLVVEPGPISSTITVAGQLAPRQEIEVTSPIEGTIAAVHFQYGEEVAEGERLLDLDTTEVRIEYRDAQMAHIKARDRLDELENWSNHVEVSRARRVVSRARIDLEARQNRLSQTTFLLEQGLIPASEHEAAKREYDNQLLDVQSAVEDLQVVLDKGAAEAEVARLELENALARLRGLEEVMRNATVYAPLDGVIMHPERGGGVTQGGEGAQRLAKGESVKQGEHLVSVGDLDGFTVIGMVDEIDVATIQPGRTPRIVGDAFPGVELQGEIVRVSSQASQSDERHGLPSFEVAASVRGLTAGQRRQLRFGMSATLEVVVYDRTDALLVPIDAVEFLDNQPRLRVRDKAGGTVRYADVVTGVTNLDSVEIVAGIEAGDEIVIPPR